MDDSKKSWSLAKNLFYSVAIGTCLTFPTIDFFMTGLRIENKYTRSEIEEKLTFECSKKENLNSFFCDIEYSLSAPGRKLAYFLYGVE